MKNTQKKLKAKHFRYLGREYVKDPARFLKEIVHQWGLNWPNNFNYLITSSLYPPMRTNVAFDYGFMHVHMGQMIEAGFVILEKCGLKPTSKEDLFQYSCKEVFNAEVEDGKIFPEKMLRAFFGFKELREWYKVLDDLLLSRDICTTNMDEVYFDLEYIPIRELLTKLPKALYEIYDRGGLQYGMPN